MRTLRLSLVGTVILVLLGGLGSVVVAQSEEVRDGAFTIARTEILSQGADESGNFVVSMTKEVSDPRLSGTWTEVWGCQEGPDYGVCVGSVRVENEGGTWLGRVESFGSPGRSADWAVLEGQGDYAGLTAFRHISERTGGEEVEEGVVFDFEMPTMPDYSEPPADE